jgi:hypothetical protein
MQELWSIPLSLQIASASRRFLTTVLKSWGKVRCMPLSLFFIPWSPSVFIYLDLGLTVQKNEVSEAQKCSSTHSHSIYIFEE